VLPRDPDPPRQCQQFVPPGRPSGPPAGTDTAAMAAYYTTVMHGLSILARDGASLAAMDAVADCAMAAWDALAQPATASRR
jgi:hypothetical protein